MTQLELLNPKQHADKHRHGHEERQRWRMVRGAHRDQSNVAHAPLRTDLGHANARGKGHHGSNSVEMVLDAKRHQIAHGRHRNNVFYRI